MRLAEKKPLKKINTQRAQQVDLLLGFDALDDLQLLLPEQPSPIDPRELLRSQVHKLIDSQPVSAALNQILFLDDVEVYVEDLLPLLLLLPRIVPVVLLIEL